jgi:hypothetical protein
MSGIQVATMTRPELRPFSTRSLLALATSTALFFAAASTVSAQARQQDGIRPIPRGVLGGVPLTPQDEAVQPIVERLSLESYTALVHGLAEFGDREQGTERNARANDWIEEQLRGWGYQTERVHYEYEGQPRSQVYATKIGTTRPDEMYIVSGHMDGRGGGQAVNDNASGTALVMEIARVMASPDIQTEQSIRFALWNNEETGLNGARAYVEQRADLQGQESPAGSGSYPEPRWLGVIQHDKVMFDHGNPVLHRQVLDADVDVEFQLNSVMWEQSSRLAVHLINANRKFAADYPAVMSNSMSNTDSMPFMDLTAAVSIRENRRLYEIGRGSDPHWHQASDVLATFSEADYLLGFNATQTTMAGVASLAGARLGQQTP